jgi:diguanylate cyclase (GGDEF)-like protein/PAS domain S-box-containing protein
VSESGGLAGVAGRWANEAIATSHVPLSYNEVRALMAELAAAAVTLLTAEPFVAEPATALGERLVAQHFTGMRALEVTLRVLGRDLLPAAGLTDRPELTDRLIDLTGALTAGYVGALRERLLDEQEMIKKAVFRARDVSERARLASEARFRAVFASSSVGIAVTDLTGRLLTANPAMSEILNSPAEDLLDASLSALLNPGETAKVLTAFQRVVSGELTRFVGDVNFLGGDGEPRWTRLSLTLVRDERDEPDYTVAVVEDISDLRLLQINQREHHVHDLLTGLPNRTQFRSRLDAMLAAAGPGTTVTLCFVDLDGFKIITDGMGQAIGDEVLRRVAGLLQNAFPEPDAYVARMGGDGFGVLATGRTGRFEISEAITSVMDELAEPVYYDGDTGVAVSASVGIVEHGAAGVTSEELVRAAELTTHRAKVAGKAQWLLYDDELHRRDQASYRLGASIPGALETGEFEISYQPVRRLADRRLVGLRTRLRWHHPTRGVLLPREFLSMAEETGFIVQLGRWWLRTVCEQIADWRQRFDTVPPVGIGVSGRMAREQDLVKWLREALADTGVPASAMQIGIPAAAAVDAEGEPLENLDPLNDIEASPMLTEFGSGNAGLVDLRWLPVHGVSLAASVVAAFGEAGPGSPFEQAISHLTTLADSRGLPVVGTGVTSEDLARRLAALGVGYGVGAALGPIASAEATGALLAAELHHTSSA